MKIYLKSAFLIAVLSFSVIAQKAESTAERKPDVKEVLKLIFQNSKTPLSVDESCRSVGSSADDKTIGDFLAGLLAFQSEPDTKNRISFTTKAEGQAKSKVWISDVMFLGEEGETVLSYGIRISLYDGSRKFVRGSIRCIGAG